MTAFLLKQFLLLAQLMPQFVEIDSYCFKILKLDVSDNIRENIKE